MWGMRYRPPTLIRVAPPRHKANPIPGPNGEAFRRDEWFDHRLRDDAELNRIVHYVEYS
jgi:hypothetical protein